MGSLLVQDVLEDASQVLIEPVVRTTLGTAITVAGSFTVNPGSMASIYLGCMLLVGIRGLNQELITVNALDPTSFTAIFDNVHASTDPVVGCTFPSGQTDHPLFTQAEMVGYARSAQRDFLLKTQLAVSIASKADSSTTIISGQRFYPQPNQAIRIERISVGGNPLFNTSQSDLDLFQPGWQSVRGDPPTHFFQDSTNTALFGVFPLPNHPTGDLMNIWYSDRGPDTLTLISSFLMPDFLVPFLKYHILESAFNKDGEQRDPVRASFCKSAYELGVNAVIKFMEGVAASQMASGQGAANPQTVGAS